MLVSDISSGNTNNWCVSYIIHIQNYWVSGFRPPSGIPNTRKQRFGNWICFRPQVKGERHLRCWVPHKELTSITGQPMSYNNSCINTWQQDESKILACNRKIRNETLWRIMPRVERGYNWRRYLLYVLHHNEIVVMANWTVRPFNDVLWTLYP
jgi:hypothetical protein